jgi:drug/metabolite transporter (DMT)-like permease
VAAFAALSPPVRAALLMLLGSATVGAMNCTIRILAADLHPFEIAFFRNLFGLLVMLPLLGAGLGALRSRRLGFIALSSIGHVISMLTYFTAVVYLPIAEVTALAFTKPLFATIGAALVLREVVRARRWSAIAIGFLGVIIVMRPGVEAVSPYAGLVLLSSLSIAVVALMIKRLTLTESATTIVLYQSLFMTLYTVPFAAATWVMPGLFELVLLALTGAFGTVGWLCFTRAFALVDASAAMPFEFSKLPFAALFAWLLFAEVPTIWTWLGGAVIFASTFYIAQREARVAQTRVAASPVPAP